MDNDRNTLEMAIATIRHGAEHPQGAFLRQALCEALKGYLDDFPQRMATYHEAMGNIGGQLDRALARAEKAENSCAAHRALAAIVLQSANSGKWQVFAIREALAAIEATK